MYLNALRAFEASARHQSFSAAAAELNVTPPAVGQLVRGLEDWIGAPLFHRSPGGAARLVATDVARQALPDIRAGLQRLSLGLERLKDAAGGGTLTVTVSPAFAAKWLLPRIERFQAAHPALDLRLDTSLKPVDFAAQRIDIGIRYGSGHWPGLEADKLLDEEVYPVCSPRLLREGLDTPADLPRQILIHDLSLDGGSGLPDWAAWLRAAGVQAASSAHGLSINNSAAVLQAAIDGRGIALARSVMAHDDVAAGRLLRLFPAITLASGLAYHVVYRHDSASLSRVAAFRDWLLAEAAQRPPATSSSVPTV